MSDTYMPLPMPLTHNYRESPYSMNKCCICDSPRVGYVIPTPYGELLPYCAAHATLLHAEFPSDPVYFYTPREEN